MLSFFQHMRKRCNSTSQFNEPAAEHNQTLGTTHTNRSSIHGFWTSRVAAQSTDRLAQAAVLYLSNQLCSVDNHTQKQAGSASRIKVHDALYLSVSVLKKQPQRQRDAEKTRRVVQALLIRFATPFRKSSAD
jgi:hypothetical protein